MSNIVNDHFQGHWVDFYSKYLPNGKVVSGGDFMGLCPFHEDHKPSLSCSNETGQFFCHGCGKKGDGLHYYGKISGLDTRKDFPKILKCIAFDFNIPMKDTKKHVVATYDYKDAKGQLLFQTVRFEPKDFSQRHRNGSKWIYNLQGVQRVLYNLPAILKAGEVLIVEGEQVALDVMALGEFTATTCPMGAGKWQAEFNDCLRGKDIVLIPDNDLPGKEHMAKVGASLDGTAKSLKLLELPGLPNKGDATDWVKTFADKEEAGERLAILIENAEPYEPPKQASRDDAIFTVEELLARKIEGKRMLLHPWLTEQSITLLSGWRGTGKTWLAMSIADAITTGKAFGPWEAGTPVPVLFVDGEMPVCDIQSRIDALCPSGNRQAPFYIYSDAEANELGYPRANLVAESWRTYIRSQLTTRKIKLLILDNLASLASGLDENVKKDWDPINQWLLELRFAGISTIMIHHVGKTGKQRGTSAREDNLDISITLKHPYDYTPEDGCRFILHFNKARVPHEQLSVLSDTEFCFQANEFHQMVWTHSSIRKERKKEILQALDEGLSQKEISEQLDIDKGYVSRIKKRAVKDCQISKNGKLTQEGFSYVHE